MKHLFESFRKFLNEVLTDIVYHLTTIEKLENILKENRFMTSIVTSSDVESNKGRFYFLSTARSPQSRYFRTVGSGFCFLVLNGNKLNQRHRAAAVNYWGASFKDSDEMEDRLIVDKPYIENATKYIEEVHVVFNLKDKYDQIRDFTIERLKSIQGMLNQADIPLWIYGNEQSWRLQDKKKAVQTVGAFIEMIKIAGKNIETTEKSDWKPSERYVKDLGNFSTIFDAVDKKDNSSLDESQQELIYRLKYYPRDMVVRLTNDIHNYRSEPKAREVIHRIFTKMRKLKIDTIKDLIDYYSKKLIELKWSW